MTKKIDKSWPDENIIGDFRCSKGDMVKPFYVYKKKPLNVAAKQMTEQFEVYTLEGTMQGKASDYLVRGVRGEYYPVDKYIFEEIYDEVDDNDPS